jgi:hypothetical protein
MSRNRTRPPLSKEELAVYGEMERQIAEADARDHVARGHRRALTDDGHLYVIEFSTGLVKVGRTEIPKNRLTTHAKNAKAHGVDVARSWVSDRHAGHSISERQLIRFCAKIGTRVTGEHFSGLDFGMTCRAASTFADAQQTAYEQRVDRERFAYLDRLLAAVNGDESKTWAEAQAALDALEGAA